MKFKGRRSNNSEIPQVNLVPMMDVLMTVLTFFIIISMTLTGEVVNVFLPRTDSEPQAEEEDTTSATFVVGLNAEQEILIRNQPVSAEQMIEQMQDYFEQNPEGIVMLKADRELTYREVSELLKTMRDVGGGRVLLGIESN